MAGASFGYLCGLCRVHGNRAVLANARCEGYYGMYIVLEESVPFDKQRKEGILRK